MATRALALILLALKYHFGLDDQQEVLLSHNAKMYNTEQGRDQRFDFVTWLRLSKLRLDYLMSRDGYAREQYGRMATIGTGNLIQNSVSNQVVARNGVCLGDLTASAGAEQVRRDDEILNRQVKENTKMNGLIKLMEQIIPSEEVEEQWQPGLQPLTKWTR